MSSQQDQPYRRGTAVVREYASSSRPFALPGPDPPPVTGGAVAPRLPPARGPAWRMLLATGLSALLLASWA